MAQNPYKPIFCTQIAYDNTTTGGKTANINGAQRLILRSTSDVYVDFDQPVATTQSYLISGSNTADTTIELTGGTINTLYARGSTGSGTLYVIVITN
ncbi:MAG: hypothetical protein C5B43_03495 [Verrucomicrobia bacterium]|nr:MAG: hypothetical protein C5B43_03495 [Verrucomicrobiota bacterium]